jgi:hypothetical protein
MASAGLRMKVRHAILHDVMGRPVRTRGLIIIPAVVELDGKVFSPSHALCDLPREKIAPVLRVPVDKGYDVSWVRARLPHAFGISPEQSENEKTMLEANFVAVEEGRDEGIAFTCCDYYGKTSLLFSPDEQDQALIARVASTFWDVLLEEPNVLADFEATVAHMGAPLTLNFGCRMGEPFYFESLDEDE